MNVLRIKYQPENPITAPAGGMRLDQFLAESLKQFSRARLQKLIAQELILVDGKAKRQVIACRLDKRLQSQYRPRWHQ